jgi:hypothetical protein
MVERTQSWAPLTTPSPSGAGNGHRRTGTRREAYVPHRDDPAELTTELYWLLAER